MIEAESSFTNVFGHDPVRNPIKSIHGQPNLVVTEALYKAYVHHRDNGEGLPGRGADAAHGEVPPGFRRRPRRLLQADGHIRTGVERLGVLLKQRGSMHGALVGSTARPPTAATVIKLQRSRPRGWRGTRPGAPRAAAPAAAATRTKNGRPHAAGTPRTFRMTEPELMAGSDVKAFQHLLNQRLAAWGIAERVAEDGVYGIDTRHAAHRGGPRPRPRAGRVREGHDAGGAPADGARRAGAAPSSSSAPRHAAPGWRSCARTRGARRA